MLSKLFVQTFRPQEPELMGRTIELLDALLRGVKVYRLTCNLDSESAVIAKEGIFGSN